MILGGKPEVVSAAQAYNHLTAPIFGPNVVYDCPNETFMQQKKFVKGGFSTENLRAYMGMIEDETLHFISKDPAFAPTYNAPNRSWGSFNSMKYMSELTILTASRTLQGREVRSRLDKTFARRFEDLDGGFTPINFLFPSLPLPINRRRDKAQREMSQFYQEIIRQRHERALNGDNEDIEAEHDVLAALDQQTYPDGTPLSVAEMAHLMIALLMAGQHTSSSTNAWALLHIADRIDVQRALYEEQVKYFGEPDGTLRKMEYEDLRNLPLLDSVIRETLRIHPPIHSIMASYFSFCFPHQNIDPEPPVA
jgi:sterol 14alpha-demethylase